MYCMSKSVIYWFSGTGNSLSIAKQLAELLGGDITLYPIAATFRGKPMELCDVVGVVFPVYGFGIPKIVAEFLKTVPATNETYFFSVANMESVCGAANSIVKRILQQRGIPLAAGFSLKMPGNYPPLSHSYTIDKTNTVLEKAHKRISDFIIPAIKSRKHNIMEDSALPLRVLGLLFNGLFRKQTANVARHFSVDSNCTKCGICEKVCPVQNITRPEGTPIWHDKCESCMACLQWCPVEAIKMPTPLRKLHRYHHPSISYTELYIDSYMPTKK